MALDRARLWGINCGDVHLLRGDMTKNEEILKVRKVSNPCVLRNVSRHETLPAPMSGLTVVSYCCSIYAMYADPSFAGTPAR